MRRLWVLGVIGLAACHWLPFGGSGRRREAPAVPPTDVLLAKARDEFRRGDFREALVSFRQLTFELGPSRPELAEARYYLAESYFQTGERVEAAHHFRQVADQSPDSPYAPLALLRAGDSHLRLWRRPELDPSHGETALAIYQELAGRYPGSGATARAQLHIRQLRAWFADKAYKNGLFYLSRRAYDSAIIYFKEVIASYPEAPRAPDALLRLVDSYRAIGYRDELRETCEHLQRFYPQAQGLARSCPADSSAT